MIVPVNAIAVPVQVDFTAVLNTKHHSVCYTGAVVGRHIPDDICFTNVTILKKTIENALVSESLAAN
jgi:hypothetical protein